MDPASARWNGAGRYGRRMDPAARYQETLRQLAIIDESAVEQHAGLGLGLPRARVLDDRTAELARVAAVAATGHRRPAWNGASPGPWRPGRPKTRSPVCCWPSPR